MLSTIENYYERLVIDRIREIFTERGEELDPNYFDDLACVALNYLPPRYVRYSIDLASHMSDEEQASMTQEVQNAVTFAIETTQRRQEPRP